MAPVINPNKRKDFPSSSSESYKERKRKSRQKEHENLLLTALLAKVLVFLQEDSTFNSITLTSMDNSDLSHNVFKQISSSPASRKDLIDLHGFTSRRGIAKCQHHYDEEFHPKNWSYFDVEYNETIPKFCDTAEGKDGSQNVEEDRKFFHDILKKTKDVCDFKQEADGSWTISSTCSNILIGSNLPAFIKEIANE